MTRSLPCPPVLLTVFRRPDTTARVLDAILDARPRVLYVAADGPRARHQYDDAACAATRALFDDIGDGIEIRRRFRDHNLGCRDAMSDAITWFLDEVGAGVILEDDCLPSPDFFPFCAALLDRYADDPRVAMVTGFNRLGTFAPAGDDDYFFSDGGIWGWATWKRAWQAFDPTLSTWRTPAGRRALRRAMDRGHFRQLAPALDAVALGDVDTWDYQWAYARNLQQALTATPRNNLVENIGFSHPGATHGETSPAHMPKRLSLDQPLRHPRVLRRERAYERAVSALTEPPIKTWLRDRLPEPLFRAARAAQRWRQGSP